MNNSPKLIKNAMSLVNLKVEDRIDFSQRFLPILHPNICKFEKEKNLQPIKKPGNSESNSSKGLIHLQNTYSKTDSDFMIPTPFIITKV